MNSYSDHNNSIQHWSKISLLNDCRRKKNFKIDHILCLMVRWALKKKNSESRSLKWAKYSRPRPWTCNTHTLSYTLNVIQVRELKLKRVIHKFIIQSKNFIDIFDFIINTDCYENQIYIYIYRIYYIYGQRWIDIRKIIYYYASSPRYFASVQTAWLMKLEATGKRDYVDNLVRYPTPLNISIAVLLIAVILSPPSYSSAVLQDRWVEELFKSSFSCLISFHLTKKRVHNNGNE